MFPIPRTEGTRDRRRHHHRHRRLRRHHHHHRHRRDTDADARHKHRSSFRRRTLPRRQWCDPAPRIIRKQSGAAAPPPQLSRTARRRFAWIDALPTPPAGRTRSQARIVVGSAHGLGETPMVSEGEKSKEETGMASQEMAVDMCSAVEIITAAADRWLNKTQ